MMQNLEKGGVRFVCAYSAGDCGTRGPGIEVFYDNHSRWYPRRSAVDFLNCATGRFLSNRTISQKIENDAYTKLADFITLGDDGEYKYTGSESDSKPTTYHFGAGIVLRY